jgi:YegS/Rv2252/BmrU family lipid kinase
MPIGQPNSFNRPEGAGTRNTQEKILLIVNPRAGGGRAAAQIDKLKYLADRAFEQWEMVTTEAPGHASFLAAEGATQGFDLVAAVGGDGTCHEVVNGLFKDGVIIRRKTAFTVIPLGTGSDLVRTLKIPSGAREALWIAATGVSLPSDLGLAEVSTPDGPREELFINEAGFGASGEVVRRSNLSSKRFGGKATFIGATLRTLATYQPQQVKVSAKTAKGERLWEDRLLSAFVANGQYCGSGMWVGAGGSMQDGHFDLSLVQPTPPLRQALEFRHLYDGKMANNTGVTRIRCSELTAEAMGTMPIQVELDGESIGQLPARFSIKPRALVIRGGWIQTPLN